MAVTWKKIAYADEVATLGTSTPIVVDGTAGAAGSAVVASKEDHIHPLGPLVADLDFNDKQAIDFCLENGATPPATPILGKMYFDTTGGDLHPYVCTVIA